MENPLASNRRLRGRVRLTGQTCSLGHILDVSATGLRIRLAADVKLREGDLVQTTLATPVVRDTVVLKVVWVRRAGLFGRDIGATVVNPTELTARVLADLARSALDRYAA